MDEAMRQALRQVSHHANLNSESRHPSGINRWDVPPVERPGGQSMRGFADARVEARQHGHRLQEVRQDASGREPAGQRLETWAQGQMQREVGRDAHEMSELRAHDAFMAREARIDADKAIEACARWAQSRTQGAEEPQQQQSSRGQQQHTHEQGMKR